MSAPPGMAGAHHEEPVLRARFGADYTAYSAAVRRWWPRLHPWRAGS